MPNIPEVPKDLFIGSIHKSNNYGLFEVVDYVRSSEVYVKFINTGNIVKTRVGKIRNGVIKDAMMPVVYGVGFMGVGDKHKSNYKVAYNKWCSMLFRCYGEKSKIENPTYSECTVCEEWHNFQNFAQWFEKNYPGGKSQEWQLDKDLKVIGNKIYSPETCIFIPQNINLFTVSRQNDRGEYMIGVTWNKEKKKFRAQCNNPFTVKNEHIGYFSDELSAHLAWRSVKSAYADRLAKSQKLDYVRDAILNYKYALDNNLVHCY